MVAPPAPSELGCRGARGAGARRRARGAVPNLDTGVL